MTKLVLDDRYKALGIPYPDPETMCKGQCEGTGWVPIHEDDPNDAEGPWHDLWLEADSKAPCGRSDRYHFVKCPACDFPGHRPAGCTRRN